MIVPLFVLLAAAEQTGAVDDRVHHRVGHAEEKYPDEISIVDVRNVHERVDDERHLSNAGVNNDNISERPTLASTGNIDFIAIAQWHYAP